MTSPRSHRLKLGSQDLDPDYKLESRGVQSGWFCRCFHMTRRVSEGGRMCPGAVGEMVQADPSPRRGG